MHNFRLPYSSEFRCQMVDLVCAGRNPDDLAREFEPTAQSVRAWGAAADRQEGRQEDVRPVIAARSASCGWSATSSQKSRLGLPERPARYRPDLSVHERKPNLLPGCPDGAHARRVEGWLLRLVASSALDPCRGRCDIGETGQDLTCQLAPDLRVGARSCRSAGWLPHPPSLLAGSRSRSHPAGWCPLGARLSRSQVVSTARCRFPAGSVEQP
jgi:transposase-like protein